MNFTGKAKRLDDIDLPRIGARIGVGEDEVHAILDVEAAGSGFDSKRRPKMLFEPHVFYRELGPGPERDKAVKEGLAWPKWKRDYPKDSYPRLMQAMTINKDSALRSCSWGLGQIMGFNCVLAGYSTAEAMVLDFLDDEERHLDAMVTFIVTAKLDRFLRARDWTGFAKGYNGPGFAKNEYDKKLRDAFHKWVLIKDTPWDGTPPELVTAPPQTATSPSPSKKPQAKPQFGGIGWTVGTIAAGLSLALANWWESIRQAVGF